MGSLNEMQSFFCPSLFLTLRNNNFTAIDQIKNAKLCCNECQCTLNFHLKNLTWFTTWKYNIHRERMHDILIRTVDFFKNIFFDKEGDEDEGNFNSK